MPGEGSETIEKDGTRKGEWERNEKKKGGEMNFHGLWEMKKAKIDGN